MIISRYAPRPIENKKSPIERLKKLNDCFLSTHKHAAKAMSLHLVDHIVICHNGELQLWEKNNDQYAMMQSENILSNLYHTHKQLAHTPLHIMAIVQHHGISQGVKAERLSVLLDEMIAIKQESGQINGIKHQPVYDVLLCHTIDYLSTVINQLNQCETIAPSKDYIEKIKKAIQSLTQSAANDVLSRMDNIMQKWMGHHAISLKRTKMAVLGPHEPGPENAEKQYLVKLYEHMTGEKNAEGDSVHYIALPRYTLENACVSTIIDDVIIPKILNQVYAEAVIGDKQAMERDVLGPYASVTVKGIFNRKKSCPYLEMIQEKEDRKNEMK